MVNAHGDLYLSIYREHLSRNHRTSCVGSKCHLNTFSFSKVNMGQQPLRVNGVKVYTRNVDKRQIILDLQVSVVWNHGVDLKIKLYFHRAGLKSIQIHGTVWVILEPLLGDVPLAGALPIFFLRKPHLVINWTKLTNLLDWMVYQILSFWI